MQLPNTRKYYLQNAWAMIQFKRSALTRYFIELADSKKHYHQRTDTDDRFFILGIKRPTDEQLAQEGLI